MRKNIQCETHYPEFLEKISGFGVISHKNIKRANTATKKHLLGFAAPKKLLETELREPELSILFLSAEKSLSL
jgi:hypothetical protein